MLINKISKVLWVAKLKNYTTFEFLTNGEVYVEEGDYECGLFRLFINSDGTMEIMTASDEDYDIFDDVTNLFDLETIKKICEGAKGEDITKDYIQHYQERKESGEDVELPISA